MGLFDDLKRGEVTQVSPGKLAVAKNCSKNKIYRRIREGLLVAVVDPVSGRLSIPRLAAIEFLKGVQYQHDPTNETNLKKMEYARRFKLSNGEPGSLAPKQKPAGSGLSVR